VVSRVLAGPWCSGSEVSLHLPCLPTQPIFPHASTHAAVTRCCMLHAAYHNMDVWPVSPTVLAPRAAHNTHPPPVHRPDRASAVSCSTRRCGCAYQRYSNTRQCRVPVADGARRGLTARHHTPRQPGSPPFSVRAGREGRSEQVASLRYALSHLTLHCTLYSVAHAANHDSPRRQPAARSELAPRSRFVCNAASATTTHVTCQCHALAWFRKGFIPVSAHKSALISVDFVLMLLG
jgi:hypothetical protein